MMSGAKLKGIFFTKLRDYDLFYYYPKTFKEDYLIEMREMIEECKTNGFGAIQDPNEIKYYDTYYKEDKDQDTNKEMEFGKGKNNFGENNDDGDNAQEALFIIIIADLKYPESKAKNFIDLIGNTYNTKEWFNSNQELNKDIMRLIKTEYCKYKHIENNDLILEANDNKDNDNEDDIDIDLSYTNKLLKSSLMKNSTYIRKDSYFNPIQNNMLLKERNESFLPYNLHLVDKSEMRQTVFVLEEHEHEEIAYWEKAKMYMALICVGCFIITIVSLVLLFQFYF